MAVATPCWPAPVSAMTRVLPMRRASSTWPSELLILWAPGVGEVFALEVDARPPGMFGQPLGEVQRRGPADVIAQQRVQLRLKRGVLPCLCIGLAKLLEGHLQGFGNVHPAEFAEVAGIVGQVLEVRGGGRARGGVGHVHTL